MAYGKCDYEHAILPFRIADVYGWISFTAHSLRFRLFLLYVLSPPPIPSLHPPPLFSLFFSYYLLIYISPFLFLFSPHSLLSSLYLLLLFRLDSQSAFIQFTTQINFFLYFLFRLQISFVFFVFLIQSTLLYIDPNIFSFF